MLSELKRGGTKGVGRDRGECSLKRMFVVGLTGVLGASFRLAPALRSSVKGQGHSVKTSSDRQIIALF